jgi:hypothetical protein
MWSDFPSGLLRLLPFVASTPDQAAQPVRGCELQRAGATAPNLHGYETGFSRAVITAGPKFPDLIKRQGNSFVGYIANGTGCKSRDITRFSWKLIFFV